MSDIPREWAPDARLLNTRVPAACPATRRNATFRKTSKKNNNKRDTSPSFANPKLIHVQLFELVEVKFCKFMFYFLINIVYKFTSLQYFFPFYVILAQVWYTCKIFARL